MPKDDQGALIVNQAAAIIVKAYLDNWQNQWDVLAAIPLNGTASGSLGFGSDADVSAARRAMIMTPDDLESLINNVQNALRQF